jgi:chemotaxis protein CheD
VNNLSVGRQNILIAMRQIEDHGLILVASDTGGIQGRKLIFKSDTGVVLLKRLAEQVQLSTR